MCPASDTRRTSIEPGRETSTGDETKERQQKQAARARLSEHLQEEDIHLQMLDQAISFSDSLGSTVSTSVSLLVPSLVTRLSMKLLCYL